MFDLFEGSKDFSKIGLKSGSCRIRVQANDAGKRAFSTK